MVLPLSIELADTPLSNDFDIAFQQFKVNVKQFSVTNDEQKIKIVDQ